MAKQGSTINGLMDTVATLISLNLQYGVPVDAIVKKFEHMRFEPAGWTQNQDIPMAKSLMDYVARWLGMQFIPGYRAANAPKREGYDSHDAPPVITAAPAHHEDLAPGHGREIVKEAANESHGNGHGNGGHGNGGGNAALAQPRPEAMLMDATKPADTLSVAMSRLMGDAPVCTCGSITVRNGSCYKCLNCGASLGCS